MKRRVLAGLLPLCLLLFSFISTAQKPRIYKLQVTYMSGKKANLYFAGFTDTSILAYTSKNAFDPENKIKAYAEPIPVSSIRQLVFRKRNRVTNGLAIGALSGFAVGAVAGLIRGEESYISSGGWFSGGPAGTKIITFTAGENALSMGFAGAFLGGATGAIIGAFVKRTFVIDGSPGKFDMMRTAMMPKLYKRAGTNH